MVLHKEEHTDDKFDGTKARAEVFMVAYTVDDAPPGPAGHVRVQRRARLVERLAAPWPARPAPDLMGDVGALLPPPYGLADNAETLLRHSDLVFIDPVSTGYSRAVKGGKPVDFHGFGGDIESVGEVIRLWTTRNGRWMSPKYLCGESYGTTRAAALAEAPAAAVWDVPERPDPDLGLSRRRHDHVRRRERRPLPVLPADLRGDRSLPRQARRPPAARGSRRGRGVRGG